MVRDSSVWVSGLAVALLTGCIVSQATSLPEAYLGRWYYVGSSGGITGRGMGDDPTGYIVIHPDNTLDQHDENGTHVDTTTFSVHRGPTIFSSEDQWVLSRGSASPAVVPEVITVTEDGQMLSLADNVYDGFVRSYARSR